MHRFLTGLFIFFLLLFNQYANCASGFIPRPNKTVIIVLENHSYTQITDSSAAPYINSLIKDNRTALFTEWYALSHPSQPNYLQLFSGSNQGVTNNNPPTHTPFSTPNLGASLINASITFKGYSEDLPFPGYTGENYDRYVKKHAPWTRWQGSPVNGIPDSLHQPFSSFPHPAVLNSRIISSPAEQLWTMASHC